MSTQQPPADDQPADPRPTDEVEEPSPDEVTAESTAAPAPTAADPQPAPGPPPDTSSFDRRNQPVFRAAPRPAAEEAAPPTTGEAAAPHHHRNPAIDEAIEIEPPTPVRPGPGPFWIGVMLGLVVVILGLAAVLVRRDNPAAPGLGNAPLVDAVATPMTALPPAEGGPNPFPTPAPGLLGRNGRPAESAATEAPAPGASPTPAPPSANPSATPATEPTIPAEPGLYAVASGQVEKLGPVAATSLPATAAFYERGPAQGEAPELHPILLLPVMPATPDGPREQWPASYYLNAWAGYEAQVRETLSRTPATPPAGRPLALRREAIAGQSDLHRLILLAPPPPGLYQLGDRARFLVEREAYARIRAEAVPPLLRQGEINRALASATVAAQLAGDRPGTLLPGWRASWRTALAELLKGETALPLNQSLALAHQLENWGDAASARTLAGQRIERATAQAGDNLLALAPLLREAQTLGYATAAPLSNEQLTAQARSLAAAPVLERPAAEAFVLAAAPLHTDPDRRNTPPARLAAGLEDLLHGESPAGFARLRELQRLHPNTPEAQLAGRLLAPPEPGRKPLPTVEPLVLEDSQSRPALELRLRQLEVGRDQVQLIFEARNVGPRTAGLLYGTPGAAEGALRLRDEQGALLASTTGFIGGRQVPLDPANPLAYRIELAPGEVTPLAVRFPLPSDGAATAEFISPPLRGQGEWRWPQLRLRAGLFEAPLPNEALPGGQLTSLTALGPQRTTAAVAAGPLTGTAAAQATAGAEGAEGTAAPAGGEGEGGEGTALRPAVVLEDETGGVRTAAPATLEEARQKADSARTAFLNSRREGQSRSSALFRAGEEQRDFSRRLEQNGELDRAAFYYEQAARIYQRAMAE